MPVDGFSTWEVAKMTGASFRQLDYWDRNHVVEPSLAVANGSGTRRRYSIDDVRRAAVIVALRCMDKGWRFEYLAEAMHLLDADPDVEFLVLTPGRCAGFRDLEGAVPYINELKSACTLIVIDQLLEERSAEVACSGPLDDEALEAIA